MPFNNKTFLIPKFFHKRKHFKSLKEEALSLLFVLGIFSFLLKLPDPPLVSYKNNTSSLNY